MCKSEDLQNMIGDANEKVDYIAVASFSEIMSI